MYLVGLTLFLGALCYMPHLIEPRPRSSFFYSDLKAILMITSAIYDFNAVIK